MRSCCGYDPACAQITESPETVAPGRFVVELDFLRDESDDGYDTLI